MPAYSYRAVHTSGRITQGRVAAANESELAQHLGHAGLELIDVRVKNEAPHRLHLTRRAGPRALAVFCTQMSDLLNANVPFVEALRDVADATEPGAMRDALMDVARAVNHGSRIAEAFGHHARIFAPVFTAILSAGEASGNLAKTFSRLARYADMRAKTGEQTKRALRYPLFMLTVALGAVTFMMTMVVPQIVQFLTSIGTELPFSTRVLIAVSNAFAAGWWAMLIVITSAALGIAALRRGSESAALFIDAAILRIPFIGPPLRKMAIARFVQNFASLFESGTGITGCMRGARATLGNRALEANLEDGEKQILAGRPLSIALEGLLPPFALRIIRIGEHSGQLGKSLYDIAATQEREVNAMTERVIGSLEPMLTLLIGLLLAWIVMAVLGPIYGGLGKLSGGG